MPLRDLFDRNVAWAEAKTRAHSCSMAFLIWSVHTYQRIETDATWLAQFLRSRADSKAYDPTEYAA